MKSSSVSALEPTALQGFVLGIGNLPVEEIEKAKALYILNAISDYRAAVSSQKATLIILGFMCIVPIFWIPAIPAFISYNAMKQNFKEKINNAIRIWEIDRRKWDIPHEF